MIPRGLFHVFCLLLFGVCAVNAQEPPNLAAEDYQKIAKSAIDRTVTAPFIKVGNSIVVRMHINGRGPFNLVLDTGAELTIVSPKAARKVKLRDSGRGIRLAGVTGGTRAILSKVDTLSLGDAKVHNLRVAVAPMNWGISLKWTPRKIVATQSWGALVSPPRSSVRLITKSSI